MTKVVYTCVYLDKKFIGTCPVTRCPAHIKTHDSGCAHVVVKKDFSFSNLAYLFNKSEEIVEEQYKKGLSNIKHLVELKSYRDTYYDTHNIKTCSACGAPEPCSEQSCAERSKIIKSLLEQYPHNISELRITAGFLYYCITDPTCTLTYAHHRIKQSTFRQFKQCL